MNSFTALPRQHWRDQFLLLLPRIESYATRAFRYLDIEARSDAVADVVANCWAAFCRLMELGKASVVYPTVLARYGVAQYRDGRRVGTSTNSRDVTSPVSRCSVASLTQSLDGEWKEVVAEDRNAGPAEIAAFRIDFDSWLNSLDGRERSLALQMSQGCSTSELADRHSVSKGRISQVRRELESSWNSFIEPSHSQEVTGAS